MFLDNLSLNLHYHNSAAAQFLHAIYKITKIQKKILRGLDSLRQAGPFYRTHPLNCSL